jgi:hypothetical protein
VYTHTTAAAATTTTTNNNSNNNNNKYTNIYTTARTGCMKMVAQNFRSEFPTPKHRNKFW